MRALKSRRPAALIALLATSIVVTNCGGGQRREESGWMQPGDRTGTRAPAADAGAREVLSPTPDAPFRAQAPEPGTTRAFTPPVIENFRLASGLQVLLVERHELPVVVVQFVSRRGGADASLERAGLASLVGSLLEKGTTTRNALELSDAYTALGAEHGAWMDWDSGGAFVKVLAPNLSPALELLADVVQRPAFAADELDRARARRLAAIQQQLDSPPAVGSIVAARAVYGETHPYSRTLIGTTEGVRAITRADIQCFHRTHFVPQDGALVVVGDITRAQLEPQLASTFGTWRARAPELPRLPPVPTEASDAGRVILVDRPGAPQSQVIVTHVGVPRTSPDHAALVVMNSILGGMFSSRINLNLREQHAYTYGARSGFSFRQGPGPFSIAAAIAVNATAPAVSEVFNEVRRMRNTDVTDAELAAARSRLVESLPAKFEGTEQTASAISELFVYGLPMDEYATFAQRVNAVTAADVRRVAERYLDPDHARIVVVGDRSVVEQGLANLGIGSVSHRTAWGEQAGSDAPSTRSPVPTPPSAPHPATPPAPAPAH